MLAHLSHYLSNNQPPSKDDANEIKAFREKPLEELSTINVEIQRIESILGSLKLKRANTQKIVDDCNTILAPVRRPSMDVWSLIFFFCVVTHRNPIMNASEAPILLTQVCRYWKSIALSTPRLWSGLYIPFPQESHLDHHHLDLCSKRVQKWLQLSTVHPLSISILPPGNSVYLSLSDAIIQSSHRWQQLELGTLDHDSDLSQRILNISADDLPMLRDLQLHSVINSEADEDVWCESGLFTAQGLRSVSIAQNGFPSVSITQSNMFLSGIPLNWKHLNTLHIYSLIHIELADELLSHCSSLVACLLGVQGSVTHLESSFLPHLEFLSLQGVPKTCDTLFRSLEAPSLQTLGCYLRVPKKRRTPGLFTFLQSIESLKTLIVDFHEVDRDTIFKCGTLTPSLTHLILGRSLKKSFSSFPTWCQKSHPDQTKLLAMLYETCSPDSGRPTLLFPSLEILEGYGYPNITDKLLLEFIRARIDASKLDPQVSKLKKVIFDFSRRREVDIVPDALAYSKAAGVDLQLELTYAEAEREPELATSWSPWYGLNDDSDASWLFPRFDY